MIFKNRKYRILFECYKSDVYAYALFMLKEEMEAEDAAQEVFVKLWQNMGKFDFNKAKSWILRTTHNFCIDKLRKRQRESISGYSLDEALDYAADEYNSVANPELNAEEKIFSEKVEQAVESLPVNLKSVFLLFEIHGFKYKEIAETLEIPLNSVKVYLLRARKKLQEALKEYEPEIL